MSTAEEWNKRFIKIMDEQRKASTVKIPTIKASYRELARRLAKVEEELNKWRPSQHGVLMHYDIDGFLACEKGYWMSEGILMLEDGGVMKVAHLSQLHKPEACQK